MVLHSEIYSQQENVFFKTIILQFLVHFHIPNILKYALTLAHLVWSQMYFTVWLSGLESCIK